jgi:hypothetical protein
MVTADNMMVTMIWWYALTLALLLQGSAAQSCPGSVLTDYMECVAQNPCECSACDPDPTDMFPVINAERPSDCLDVARVFCPLIRCCSICQAESLAWNQCSANGFSANYLGRECPLQGSCVSYPLQDIDCTPTMSPSESPNSSPTDIPIPAPTATPNSEPTAAPVPFEVLESPTASPDLPRTGISVPTLAPSLSPDMESETETIPSGTRSVLGLLRLSSVFIVTTLMAFYVV